MAESVNVDSGNFGESSSSSASPETLVKDEDGQSVSKKAKKSNHYRKNIKDVLTDDKLQVVTKEAKAEESERLKRLEQQRKELLEQVFIEQIRKQKELEAEQYFQQQNQLLQLQRLHQLKQIQREQNRLQDGDQAIVLSSGGEETEVAPPTPQKDDEPSELEDPNNSGMHVDDRLNVPNADGRVVVNVGHPASDPDIFLAPQIQRIIKPHQIGGVRFMYDNLIESIERYKSSQGFGCILAHAMGLGKTLQVVAFVDVFLRHTAGNKVLCIVPINTIQNWMTEFHRWLPSQEQDGVRARNFNLYLLNDNQKNLEQRSAVIFQWEANGGVLLMGYELFRLLATKTQRKKRKRKAQQPLCVDLEEEDRERNLLDSK